MGILKKNETTIIRYSNIKLIKLDPFQRTVDIQVTTRDGKEIFKELEVGDSVNIEYKFKII